MTHLDQTLVDAAIEQMRRRWPAREYAGAAAVYLDDGQILTSVSLDNMNAAVGLCHETGAFCQAYTMDRQVTASVCVCTMPDDRPSDRPADRIDTRIVILAPCGVCQERLALWGPDVEVAVADPDDPTRWQARTLAEVNPHYWARQFAEGRWPSYAEHAE